MGGSMRRAVLAVVLATLCGPAWSPQHAAGAAVTVEQFAPQGTVKRVRQVTARFSAPMVPFGDLRDVADPFVVDCPEPGTARWVDSRNWAYDFRRDLPAGVRCTFTLRSGLRSLAGQLAAGPDTFAFSTGGPAIRTSYPYAGNEAIEEEQAFVLVLDGEATPESVLAHAGFAVDGLPERIGVNFVEGEAREVLLTNLFPTPPEAPVVILRSRQRFPNAAKVRLIWGAGIRSPSGVATDQDQAFEFKTRPEFTVKFSCEREHAQADCIPLTPMSLIFSAPVAWGFAQQITLTGPDGQTRHPEQPENPIPFVSVVRFPGPFPESSPFTLAIPEALRDDAGRRLANRRDEALAVKTAPFPPLAKFAARFGILEAKADPALPLTVRNLEPELRGQELRVTQARPTGWGADLRRLYERLTGTVARIPADKPEEILAWLRRVAIARRDRSVFAAAQAPGTPRAFTLPKPGGAKEFEVVGIPFDAPGLYVVELASPRLGASLLGADRPMYVPAAALVTNLSVHFKWGRESSLVWVTTLDRAQPVEGARVGVHDCHGNVLATGTTDRHGVARITGLPKTNRLPFCRNEPTDEPYDPAAYADYYASPALSGLTSGLFITAQTEDDLSFVHSSWMQGIEPWRFQLPMESWLGPTVAHTIFDRPLFRAGDTVHMTHVLRRRTMAGFDRVDADARPKSVVISHTGSDQTYELPLAWDDAGSAETAWPIPAAAKLGLYAVTLKGPDRQWSSGTFRLEQFRVPLMKAAVQLPTEPLVAAPAAPVDVAVQYLAGGPAADLPVTVRAQIRPKTFVPPEAFARFTVANGPVREGIVRAGEIADEEADGQPAAPAIHQRRELRLDQAGGGHTLITDLPPGDTVRELVAEVEFRDPNGEVQTVASSASLFPAALLPGIDAEYWAGTKDDLHATIAVLDTAGHAVGGAAVHLDAFERVTYSYRTRLVGGFYAYEHVEETRAIGRLCNGATDTRGVFACAAPAPRQGHLILQATVTDPEGRVATAHTGVWVAGERAWGFAVDASDRIDVLPERPRYEPGETARFQVRMPFQRATALVSVEREGVGEARVVELSGGDAVVDVPIRGAYAPNVFVSVFVVRGRVGGVQPTAMVDLGRPAFKLGVAEIRVGWQEHALSVTVTTDRPVYHVRDKATVTVAVRTAAGAPPAGGEVAIAAVDEGLLELLPNRSWNLLDAMMGRRGYAVHTATAQMEVIGKRHYGRKALPTGGGGGRQATRELFDTLLLWRGRVPLDAAGTATVEVPLNDSLTTFRIAAIATADVGRFGNGSTTIRSTQDLMLFAGIPPLVREGDELPAQFTVRNTTERPMRVAVRAAVEGLTEPFADQALDLAPGEARVVEWPVRVPAGVDQLRYRVEAASGNETADRLSVIQQVRPAVPVRTVQATLLHWEQPLRERVQRPGDALPGRGGIEVSAAASLGGNRESIREWFRSYRYTCLEQQVSVAVGLGDEARWQAVAAALPSYLDGDGLLKYFPTVGAGSEVLTAYIVAVTHTAGWELPPRVRERVVNGLRGFVTGRVVRQSALRTPDLSVRKLAAIDALARLGAAEPALLDSVPLEPNLWPTSAVLDWWSVLQRLPALRDRDARLREAEHIVRARLNLQGTSMGFSTEQGDRLWWLMTSPDANAVRLVLHLVEFGLWRDDVPRLMRAVLGRQRAGRWDTTVANAWGVLAMERFAAAFESTPVTGTTAVALAGASRDLEWVQPPVPVTLPWPPGAADLSVDHRGTGHPWITLASRAAVPITAPRSTGFHVTRTVTPIEPRQDGRYSVGDKLRVRLEVEAQSDMTWVVVDDPIPAGASHLGTGLARDSQIVPSDGAAGGDYPAFVERPFDAYRAYFEYVPKGGFSTEYVIRLNQSGRFEMPATRVEALYAPEMFGEIPNAPVEVEP